MAYVKRLILFLIINFGVLGLGGWAMNGGPTSEWYQSLNIAPWTPPGWVFGFAWTLIMVLLSVFMAKEDQIRDTKLRNLYLLQLALNFIWNPLFFNWHFTFVALIVIVLLTLNVFLLFLHRNNYSSKMKWMILPYLIWLCIATSLNFYAWFYN